MHADWTSVGDDEGHDGFTHSSCAVRFRELPAVSAGASNGEVKLTMSCYQLEAPEQNKQTYALQLTSILVTTHPLLIPLISLLSLCHRSASSFLYSDTPILADKAIPSTEEGMANTSETQDINGPSKRTLQIAFLVCDEPAEPTLRKHGGFHDLMHGLLEPLIKEEHADLHLNVKGYDVVDKRQYPTREDLENVDCVCISGSFVEYAGVDTPWIMRLIGYVVYLHDEFPRIRLVGICFGHQIIARAFGAKVKSGEDTWEIGSTKLTLTSEGKKLICDPEDQKDTLRIQQMHSDYVETVPEGFKLLAKSPRCPVQALVKYYSDEHLNEMEDPPEYRHGERRPPKPYSMIHIFTCQGHPEWHAEVIEPLIDEFLKDGKIDEKLAEEARENTKKEDDSKIFGRALMRQLGIIWTKTREAIESGKVTPEAD